MPEPAWLAGQRAAQALRLEEGLGFAPINIWEVIRRRGVKVARREFGGGNGDGLYLWDEANKEGLIVVNSSERASKQRFTGAHELGHHEMHRFEGTDIAIADKNIFDTGNDPAEVAANAFAAYLMAPNEALQHEFAGTKMKEISAADVVRLMREFGLSYESTVYRLNNAGLVNAATRQRLLEAAEGRVEQMVAEAGFDEETLVHIGDDVAARTVDGAFRLYRDAVISAERLAQIVQASPEEAIARAEAAGFARTDERDIGDDEAVLALLT